MPPTPHDSPETRKLTTLLPQWMKLQDQDSLGWRFLNVLHGLPHEEIQKLIRHLDESRSLSTADPNEVREVYRVDINEDFPNDWAEASGFGRLIHYDGVPLRIAFVDTATDFFNAPPTRWSYDKNPTTVFRAPEITLGDTTHEYDASGIIGIIALKNHPGSPSGAYLVNWNVPATWPSGTTLYDADWMPISGYQWGLATQSYATTGSDEILFIDPETGSGTLAHDPIDITIYDIANLDASGNAREVPSVEYTVAGNEVGFVDPSSTYIAEYSYQAYPWLKGMNTAAWFHGMHDWSVPVMPTDPNTGDNYVTVPHEMALSEPSFPDRGTLLRVHPNDLRPSGVARVTFNRVRYIDATWEDPSASGISVLMGGTNDPNYISSNAGAFNLETGGEEVPKRETPSEIAGQALHISGVNLIVDPNVDGTVVWRLHGDNAEINTDKSFLPSGHAGYQGLELSAMGAVGSGSFIIQETFRPIQDYSYILSAKVTSSGTHIATTDDPTEVEDPATAYINTGWYDRDGEYLGSVEIKEPLSAMAMEFTPLELQYVGDDGGTYSTCHSTWIQSALPNVNYDIDTNIYVYSRDVTLPSNNRTISLVQFPNIIGTNAGQIPLGSVIHSGGLSLWLDAVGDPTPAIFAHRVLVSWDTTQATWMSRSTGVPWTEPGGVQLDVDINGEPDNAESFYPNGYAEDQYYDINIASGIQAWVNGADNYGWLILASGGLDQDNEATLASDAAAAGRRPILEVAYSPPAAALSEEISSHQTIRKEIRIPLGDAKGAHIELGASGGTVFYHDVRLEPRYYYNSNLEPKWGYPWSVRAYYNMAKNYDMEGVQALSTPSGLADPYPYDWTYEDRYSTTTGQREPHIVPYTMLNVMDTADAVLDEMLPSGVAEDFIVQTQREFVGIEIPPDEIIADASHIDRRVRYLLDRHQQVIHVQDMAGTTVEKIPIFSPDMRRMGMNERAQPSGGSYMYPVPVDTAYPLMSFEMHNDNPHDPDDTQAYREPRSIAWKDGNTYVITAVTADDSIYRNRDRSPSHRSIFFQDSIIYRLDLQDKVYRHLTPPSGDIFPLAETMVDPSDSTWDTHGDLLIAQSGQIHTYTPHYDVGMADPVNKTVFFREVYKLPNGMSGVIM